MYFFIEQGHRYYSPRLLTSHKFKAKPGGRNPRHAHPVYHILLFESGRGWAILGNRRMRVERGVLLLISPDVEHQFIADDKDPHVYRQVTFDLIEASGKPAFFSFQDLFLRLGEPVEGDYFVLDAERFKRAQGLIAPFLPFGDSPPGTQAFLRSSQQMLVTLFEGLVSLLSDAGPRLQPDDRSGGLTEKVNAYLKEHYGESLKLKTIAAAMGLSPFHLSRKFKEAQGANLFATLNDYRLKVAANLLKHSHYTIKEVAAKTGFCDVHYLSKAFKKKFGAPPRAFQKDAAAMDWMVTETVAKPNPG